MDVEQVTITMSGNTITDSKVTGMNVVENYAAAVPDKDAKILQELQRVREKLETTEPMIADSLATLEQAVKAKNEPKISECLRKFSGETVKGVMVKVASAALLSWMGIS